MAIFQRNAYSTLLDWKHRSQGKTAMLIEGARRVGKSTLAEQFAKNEYTDYLFLDFSRVSDDILDLFRSYRSDIGTFFMYLKAYTGARLPQRDSLIVFDEVQRFPQAREFIKQLVADGRYDYLETGSLISIKRNVSGIVIPSEEESMRLGPLNFEEFLRATGEESLIEPIRDSFERLRALPDMLHRKAERLFREYMLVGGMPQAVNAFIEQQDFGAVDAVKREILALYRNDIAQFGQADATRIARIFSTIPGQLARRDKKFKLTSLDQNARSRDYADAFFWLADACISNTCYNVDDPSVGLSASMDESSFKCYMADTGLLVSQMFADNATTPHEVYRDILLGKLAFNEGMLTENVVAQQLVSNGHRLFFYSQRDDANNANTMEIDFLLSRGYDDAAGRMRVSPIEVKSSHNYQARSLEKFKTKFGKRVGTRFILHPRPLCVEGDIERLPLYMSWCL